MAMALEDVRIVDLTHILSGPFCSTLLADMGADVVKIERPETGDDLRESGRVVGRSSSSYFVILNRNKKSVALDLRNPAGRQVLLRLLENADVLIENFRPGTMDRLQLGYRKLHAQFPGLIYCSISGFGQTGPYRDRGGFDIVAQAMSGVMSVTGHSGGPLTKAGVSIADLNAGMYACYAVLAALHYRDRTGQGQLIDVSLLDAALGYTWWESAELWTTGAAPEPVGAGHRDRAPYQPLRCSDGFVAIGAGNDHTWRLLCDAIGRADLIDDPRFAENRARVDNLPDLITELESALCTQNVAFWVAKLNAAGCPAGPVLSLQETYKDPQVLNRGMLAEIEHPDAGRVQTIGVVPKLSATPGAVRSPAPLLGQHTRQVLTEICQFSDDEVHDLVAAGAAWPGDDDSGRPLAGEAANGQSRKAIREAG